MYLGMTLSPEVRVKRGIVISSVKYDPQAHENRHKNRDNTVWCQDPGACVLCDQENLADKIEHEKHWNRTVQKYDVPWCDGFPDCLRCEKARDF